MFDAEGLERGDFLGFGGQPRQAGMLDHVVEREQAPHEYGGRGVAAVADVLGSDGPVDPPGEDAAHAADPPDAGHGVLGGQALRDQRVDDAPHLFRVCIEEYDFPEDHWKHLRTTNVGESPFAAVRLKTTAAKRFKRGESATALIWKLLLVAEKRFRRLDAPHLLKNVFEGRKFEDGKPVSTQQRKNAA